MKRFLATVLMLLPQVALAQQPLGNTGNTDFTYARLVRIVVALVNIILQICELAAVGFIVWYGLRMVMSKGDPAKFSEAKKGLGLAIVGALVIFGVYTIIATVQGGVQGLGN
jgi:TRAP-type C4-dicarboxylate transport system permease small subunit